MKGMVECFPQPSRSGLDLDLWKALKECLPKQETAFKSTQTRLQFHALGAATLNPLPG